MPKILIPTNSNTFWLNNPSILFKFPYSLSFIPKPSKNYIYNLNAFSRIFIVFCVLGLIFGNINMFVMCLFGLIVCIIIYKFKSKKDNFLNIDDNILDKEEAEDIINYKNKFNSDALNYAVEDDKYNQKFKFYNDRNNEHLNKHYTTHYDNIYNIPIEKQFNNLDKLEPLKQNIPNQFLNDSDAFSYINNERLKLPIIEQNQGRFANWLYKGVPNCKTDQYQCLKDQSLNLRSKLI